MAERPHHKVYVRPSGQVQTRYRLVVRRAVRRGSLQNNHLQDATTARACSASFISEHRSPHSSSRRDDRVQATWFPQSVPSTGIYTSLSRYPAAAEAAMMVGYEIDDVTGDGLPVT